MWTSCGGTPMFKTSTPRLPHPEGMRGLKALHACWQLHPAKLTRTLAVAQLSVATPTIPEAEAKPETEAQNLKLQLPVPLDQVQHAAELRQRAGRAPAPQLLPSTAPRLAFSAKVVHKMPMWDHVALLMEVNRSTWELLTASRPAPGQQLPISAPMATTQPALQAGGLPGPIRVMPLRRRARRALAAAQARPLAPPPTHSLVMVIGLLTQLDKWSTGHHLFLEGDWARDHAFKDHVRILRCQQDTLTMRQELETTLAKKADAEQAQRVVEAWGLAASHWLQSMQAVQALQQLQISEPDAAALCSSAKAAVAASERKARSAAALLPDVEDLGLAPLDLVGLRTTFMRPPAPTVQNPSTSAADGAQLQPLEREGVSLSVTDLTSAAWCGLQLAYQTATGRRKRQTFAMATGGQIHEAIELEVVQKVDILAETAEDALAITLLNAVSCIRQLVTEGTTRELRVFARLEGQWVVGVIDGLQVDAQQGVCVLTETKTRIKCSMPPREQVDSARLQVMVYRRLYDGFKALSLEDMNAYLFQHSTSGVGLRPSQPLGTALTQLCTGFFPHHPNSNPDQSSHHQQGAHTAATVAQSSHHQPDASHHQQGANTAATAASQGPGHSSFNGTQEAGAGSQQQAVNGHSQGPVLWPSSQPETTMQNGHANRTVTQPINGAVTQPTNGAVAQPANEHATDGHHPVNGLGALSQQESPQGQPSHSAAGSEVEVVAAGAVGAGRWTLADCVRLLHESLEFLPPAGEVHGLEYLWQHDPRVVIGQEVVPFEEEWLGPRLGQALALWTGKAAPRAVPKDQTWKCRTCDFSSSCRLKHPDHPMSDPSAVAAVALQERAVAVAAAVQERLALADKVSRGEDSMVPAPLVMS